MKWAKQSAALVLAIAYLFLGSGLAYADTRPYFRAYGADVFAGAWFNSGANACSPSASTFQAPTYSPAGNLYKGGVMGYGISNGAGANSQYAALSLGTIEANVDAANPYGFSTTSTSKNKLSFANNDILNLTTATWGGFLEGSDTHQAAHCLPDYFGTKQSSPTIGTDVTNPFSLNTGQYYVKPGGLQTLTASAPITAGRNVTVFIEGNVYISSNITYAAHTVDNIPKFALVVKGSIYIAPGVSQLDGFYVAQPDTSVANPTTADTGVIWTCHDNNPGVAPTALWVSANCRTTGPNKGKLTFNGGVVAKQINMLRLDGDVLGAGAVPNELSSSATTAEVFNFTPEMVMGGAFFNGGNANRYKIESLISLPPVF